MRVNRNGAWFCVFAIWMAVTIGIASATAPATTLVTDTIYRADGSAAAGTLLITWPAFTTADSKPVAAGTMNVIIGVSGAVSIPLAPNAGAAPDGTFYRVVYKLSDGVTSTEFWVVPAASPTTISAVRSSVVPTSVAIQTASRQYVDSQVSTKAADVAVVHKSGSESIAGVKQFSAPPSIPAPIQATDAANKAYVDQSVANVGTGSFVAKAGDVMTGPLSLGSDPTAPTHAARKQYVDTQLASKADKVSGLVPVPQLGTGLADNNKCLKGDQTWGACGASGNAVQVQGKNVDSVVPSATGQQYTWDNTGQSWKVQKKVDIDARDWGVKCDGVTDDAAAMQAMFNSLAASTGATVRFPASAAITNKCVITSSRITIRGWDISVKANGTRFLCNVNDYCFVLGSITSSTDSRSITWDGGQFFSGVNSGTNSVFLDNSQNTQLIGVMAGDQGGAQRFGHFIENWDDENGTYTPIMNGIGHFIRCDATFCGSAIYAPGPFGTKAGIGHVVNADLGMQCGGNGIEWRSGNALDVSNSVIQGYAEYGVLMDRADGFAPELPLNNVYFEVGNCANPLGNVGQAMVIAQGALTVRPHGGEQIVTMPQFSSTGSNYRMYYVVAYDSVGEISNMLPLGSAATNNTTPITVVWPKIAGAAKYDVLVLPRLNQSGNDGPYGTGNYAVTTNFLQAACGPSTCTVTDNPAVTPGSYTFPKVYQVNWYPRLDYWPGGIVLTTHADSTNDYDIAAYDGDVITQFVSVARTSDLNVRSLGRRDNAAATPTVLNSVGVAQVLGTWPGAGAGPAGSLFMATQEPYGPTGNQKKGRINFGGFSWDNSFMSDLITCRDSGFDHTLASSIQRPTWDAADCALGVVGSDIGFLRAKTGWRFYFNALPTSTTDSNGIDLNSGGINLPSGASFKIGGGNIAPLSAKGDLLGFGAANSRVAVGTDGQCLVADSTQAVGLKWGACGTGGGGGTPSGVTATVQFNDNGAFGGVTGFSFNKVTGDLTVPGRVVATAVQTTGAGAWSVEGGFAALTAPAAGNSTIGFGAAGQVQVAENGSATFFDLAKVGHTHTAGDVTSGILSAARLPVMVASGTLHAAGTVPDPGATSGVTRYLREDATWSVPAAGGTTTPGGLTTQVQFNDGGIFSGDTGLLFDKTAGSLTVSGVVTAASFATSGTGPWSVEGSFGTLSSPAAGKSKVGFGVSGQLQVSENGAATFADLSKVGHPHAESDVTNLVTDLAGKSVVGHAHVESDVTNLVSDLPKGLETTKGDLIAYGSAPARLGVGADGQVLMADSTGAVGVRWANGPGVNINTIGNGFLFLPYLTIPQGAAAGTVVAGTANQLRVLQFVLPLTITVGKVVANVTTISASQNIFAGVYDASGNKQLSATLSCAALNGVSTTLGTPVTLTPGTYFYAYSASDTICAASGMVLSAGWANIMSKNTTRTATAANSVAAGVMPATLGTLTFASGFTPILSMLER